MSQKNSIKTRVLSGSVWTVSGTVAQQALRFLSNLILTRLLEPELFGLMALMTTLRVGLELFSDVGLGHNIIQSEQGSKPEFYNTAWTIQVIRGFILWGISLLVTIPAANFYQEDRLLYLFPIIGFSTVLDGFTSTSGLLLKKKLRVGLVTVSKLCIRLLSLIIMIVWASIYPSIWALVAGTISFTILGIVSSHFILPGPPNRFCWDKKSIDEILNFGKWIFISTILFYLANQSDRLILPKMYSLEILGVYAIAYSLASLPRQALGQMINQVVFPAFSEIKALPRQEFRLKISNPRRSFLILSSLGISVLATFGDFLITFLYDSRYEGAAWMFSILCVGVWFSILEGIGTSALLAFGSSVYNAYAKASKLLVLIFGMYLGNRLFGLPGTVVAISLADLGAYLGIQYGLYQEKICFPMQDFMATLFLVGLTVACLTVRHFLGWGVPLENLFAGI